MAPGSFPFSVAIFRTTCFKERRRQVPLHAKLGCAECLISELSMISARFFPPLSHRLSVSQPFPNESHLPEMIALVQTQKPDGAADGSVN